MGFTSQDFDGDENDGKSAEIPKDFYKARFKEANPYTKDDGDRRLALIFEVEYDGEVVELGRFLTAKATTYSDELKQDSEVSDSDLGALFDDLGLLKALELEISSRISAKDWFDGEIPDGFLTEKEGGFEASTDNEHDLLADCVSAQLEGHRFKILAVTPDGSGGSLVEDVDPVDGYDYTGEPESGDQDVEDDGEDGEESEEGDDGDEEDGDDVLFEDESDALDDEKDTLDA